MQEVGCATFTLTIGKSGKLFSRMLLFSVMVILWCAALAAIFEITSNSYFPNDGIPDHMEEITVTSSNSTSFICGAVCDAISDCMLFCTNAEICIVVTKNRSKNVFSWPPSYSSEDFKCMLKFTNQALLDQFGISVARNKTAMQSSVFSNDGKFFCEARLAVDGNYDPAIYFGPFRGSLAMTLENGTDKLPWWQVDLVDQHLIVGVSVFKRSGGSNHARAQNIEVRVGDVAFTAIDVMHEENFLCFRDNSVQTVVLTRNCDRLLKGRYVSIQKLPQANPSTRNMLDIAEMDVFGFPL